jgi:hypothetical protein
MTTQHTGCKWQTETGTINSPQVCGQPVQPGFLWCAEHLQDAKDIYPHLPIPHAVSARRAT